MLHYTYNYNHKHNYATSHYTILVYTTLDYPIYYITLDPLKPYNTTANALH